MAPRDQGGAQSYGSIAITDSQDDDDAAANTTTGNGFMSRVKAHSRWWIIGGAVVVTAVLLNSSGVFQSTAGAGADSRSRSSNDGVVQTAITSNSTTNAPQHQGEDEEDDSGLPPLVYDDDIKDPSAIELFYKDQLVDHFSDNSTETWSHRYYTSDKMWGGPGNPIFVIMGGEGAVANILYPFVSGNLAWEFRGFVLQTEHRFYGDSQPTNKPKGEATNQELLDYLSPEQAMADFVRLIGYIQDDLGCSTDRKSAKYCPVVTVGASYPGFLAAMMRFVYPDVVDIAYASSAPVPLYAQQLEPNAYFEKITAVAEESSPGCAKAVKTALLEIEDALHKDYDYLKVAAQMGICVDTLPKYINNIDVFRDVVTMVAATSFADFNMGYYPPNTNDTELVQACKAFESEEDSDRQMMNGFFKLKGTTDAGCFDLRTEVPDGKDGTVSSADWSGVGDGNSGRMWDFQTCKDLVVQAGFSKESMFIPRKWTLEWLTEHCQTRFGVTPQPTRLMDRWGFDDLVGNGGSYILFTNGLNDGWSVASHLNDLSDTILALNFPNGAHHSDLGHEFPFHDTKDIKEGHVQITKILSEWLEDLYGDSASKHSSLRT